MLLIRIYSPNSRVVLTVKFSFVAARCVLWPGFVYFHCSSFIVCTILTFQFQCSNILHNNTTILLLYFVLHAIHTTSTHHHSLMLTLHSFPVPQTSTHHHWFMLTLHSFPVAQTSTHHHSVMLTLHTYRTLKTSPSLLEYCSANSPCTTSISSPQK